MGRALLPVQPRLLPEPEAAAYLGVSRGTLRTLEIPRRVLGAKRLYDRSDLDSYASNLPYEGEDGDGVAACDRAFG